MHAARPQRSCQRGFTLMELMVAVVIVGILAAIALPSYRSYVLRANRALARATLVDIAAKFEVEALRTRAYPSSFDFYVNNGDASSRLLGEIEIGLESDGKLTEEGEEAESSTSIYSIKMTSDATSFLLRAIAQNGQKDDTECRELHLSSTGLRSSRPDNHPVCWSR